MKNISITVLIICLRREFSQTFCSPTFDGIILALITENYINILLNQKYGFLRLYFWMIFLKKNQAYICGVYVYVHLNLN